MGREGGRGTPSEDAGKTIEGRRRGGTVARWEADGDVGTYFGLPGTHAVRNAASPMG